MTVVSEQMAMIEVGVLTYLSRIAESVFTKEKHVAEILA